MSRALVLSRARELAGISAIARPSPPARNNTRKLFDVSLSNRLTADWTPIERLSADAELQGRLPIIRSRSRDHEQNDPYAESFLKLREDNVVGHDGFTLQMKVLKSETEDPATGELVKVYDIAAGRAIERAWRRFNRRENFLVTRDMHAIEACKLWERTYNRDGDFLIRKIKGAPNEFGFALQPLEADYLDDQFIEFRGVPCNCPLELTLPDGSPFPYCQRRFHEVRMGVELHGDWKFPVAYWILGNHPGDYFYGNQYASRRVRVRVDEVIHVFGRKRIEQTRGIPATVAAMMRLQMIGGMDEAALVAARTAAQKMGVITKEVPEDFVGDGGGEGEGKESGFDPNALEGKTIEGSPGEFLELPMGFDIKSIDWKGPDNDYEPFQKKQLRGAAAGMGVSYSSLAQDPSDANFSATRIGMLGEREGFRGGQHFFIVEILLQIFPDFLESAMLRGIVDLPFSRFDDFTDDEAVRFHGRGFPWIDPEKDIAAAEASVDLGVDTRSRIAAENAGDFEEITAELAREKKLRTAAGLVDPPPPKPGTAAPTDDASATTKALSTTSSAGSLVATNMPDSAPLGYCPHCGNAGASRERRPGGNDTCSQGHVYPSDSAVTIDGLPCEELPPNAPLTAIKSAFLGDISLGELPDEVETTVQQFAPGAHEKSRVARYGMTVPELLRKADPHNLETARTHIRNMTNKDAKAEVRAAPDKHILLVNDRIVDGHHHLAKAEKGKMTRSLPVLDLTPLRFQGAPTKSWVTIDGNHVLLGPDTGGGSGGGSGRPAHEAAFDQAHPVVGPADPAHLAAAVAHFNLRKRGLTVSKAGEPIGGIVLANASELQHGSKPFKLVDFMAPDVGGHKPDLRYDSIEEAAGDALKRGFHFPDLPS